MYEGKIDVNDLVLKYIFGVKDMSGDKIKGKDKFCIIDIFYYVVGFFVDL